MNESQPTIKRQKQRSTLNRFIDRPVDVLVKHHITANQLSFLGFFCSVAAALFLALNTIHSPIFIAFLAPFLMFMSGAFDVFDGEVARRTGKEGPVGAFLDSNLDRLSDAVIILGLIYGGLITYFLGFLILFLSIMISYTRSRAENEGVDMRGVGLLERAERMIALMCALILETWINFFSELSTILFGTPSWIYSFPLVASRTISSFFMVFILAYTFLLAFTIAQRIVFAYKKLNNPIVNENIS